MSVTPLLDHQSSISMSCSSSQSASTCDVELGRLPGHEHGASSTPATPNTYHVFLSFRGADTRYGFADWLYHELEASGLRTFRDDDEIQRGENIEREIEQAIRESQVGLIVFSKDFASSPYCLDEVVMLMERKRTAGIAVIPVFFEVDPSSVSEQMGSFGVSFEQHEKKLRGLRSRDRQNERRRLDRWREALREAADLGGMVYQHGYQSLFVKGVVKEVAHQVNYTPLLVPSFVVGIDSQLEEITSWMQGNSTCPSIALIYGIGGVGKTVTAKLAYNQNFKRFERSCFLANVRETLEQSNGLVLLQKQLLTHIERGGTRDFHDPEEGSVRIRYAICRRRVLIVLDDVDQSDHIKAIIGGQDWLDPGSKIIITTRNRGLFEPWDPVLSVGVHPWDDGSVSLQLFSWHAFGQPHPVEAYLNVSKRAVRLCCGLPLALEVLGSSLCCRSLASWESILGELDTIIEDDKVKKVLRISYESLKDDLDKDLFLDVACFFIGKNKEYVQKILEGCQMYGRSGNSLKRLINRCLVAVDENDKLTMHPLIRDIGRDIVFRQSSNVGERSRIWSHQDAFSILQKNNATGAIRTFILDQEEVELSSEPGTPYLRAEALLRMNNLKLLHLKNTRLEGDFDGFPNGLVWFSWHGFPLSSIARRMMSNDLVVLDLQNSHLQFCWEGSLILKNLKILNVSHSYSLLVTPNFEGLPSLEILVLAYCINMVKIDESIGRLKQLSSLDLTGCINLKELPSEIANLKSLKELSLGGCLGLLQVQRIQGSSLLPAMQIRLSFPVLPTLLVKLSLENCNISDDGFPHDLSILPLLDHLDLSFNPVSTLPESITRLASLRSLWLMGCEKLRSLPQLPTGLQDLIIVKCRSLQRIASLPTSAAVRLLPVGCENLLEIGEMFKLREIQSIDSEMINKLHFPKFRFNENMRMKWFHNMTRLIKWSANQVLHEFGIFSVFLPGSRIPIEYRYQTSGHVLKFRVPRLALGEVIGLNLCVLYKEADADGAPPGMPSAPFHVVIWNIDGNQEWAYCPTAHVVACELPVRDGGATVQYDAKLLWWSRWNLRGQLRRGHHVAVLVLSPRDIEVESFGIRLVYEKEVDHEEVAAVTSTHSYTGGKLTSHRLVHFPIVEEPPCMTWELERRTLEELRGLLYCVNCLGLACAIMVSLVIKDARKNVFRDTIWMIWQIFFRGGLNGWYLCASFVNSAFNLWRQVNAKFLANLDDFSWFLCGSESVHSTRSYTSTSDWLVHFPIVRGFPSRTWKLNLKIREKDIDLLSSMVFATIVTGLAPCMDDCVIKGALNVLFGETISNIVFVAMFLLAQFCAFLDAYIFAKVSSRPADTTPSRQYATSSWMTKAEAYWERCDWLMAEYCKRSGGDHGKQEQEGEEYLQRQGDDHDDAISRACPVPSGRGKGLDPGGKLKTD